MSAKDDAQTILDGLEGVTPGPWVKRGIEHREHLAIDWVSSVDGKFYYVADCKNLSAKSDNGMMCRPPDGMIQANAAHIASCSPDRIGPICTRLLELEAENERLRAALQKIATGDGAYGLQASGYKAIARGALKGGQHE